MAALSVFAHHATCLLSVAKAVYGPSFVVSLKSLFTRNTAQCGAGIWAVLGEPSALTGRENRRYGFDKSG